jgi:hypothetical protein
VALPFYRKRREEEMEIGKCQEPETDVGQVEITLV